MVCMRILFEQTMTKIFDFMAKIWYIKLTFQVWKTVLYLIEILIISNNVIYLAQVSHLITYQLIVVDINS